MADKKKIYCEILEAVTFSDRCLFKLSKIVEGNKTCENCILRQFELIKKCAKAGRSGADDIKDSNVTKVTKVTKVTNGPKGVGERRRRIKPMPKRKPRPIADAPQDPGLPYTVQALSKLIGKSERRIQELAKEGKIPGQKIGMVWQFSREEIDRWLSGKKESNDIVMTSSLQPDQSDEESSKPQDI